MADYSEARPAAHQQLRLMQLADSALPIGATAHSFGLETLVAEGLLRVEGLGPFLGDYIEETGTLEGLFCRAAYTIGSRRDCAYDDFAADWLTLNQRLGALKPARESRAANAMLGRRLLRLVLNLEEQQPIRWAAQLAAQPENDAHHSTAFGLVGGALALGAAETVLACLQQMLMGLVSACQRLMPLGQSQASALIWQLQPGLLVAAQNSEHGDWQGATTSCFAPLVDIGGMRHPTLYTRLFMS